MASLVCFRQHLSTLSLVKSPSTRAPPNLQLSSFEMQFKFFTAAFVVCMTALVSAAPVPVLVTSAVLDLETREIPANELITEVARAPEPVCSKYQCW